MTPPEKPKLKEGWFKLLNASKWHYFTENGRSLCRKWTYLGNGDLEPDLNAQSKPSPDECKVCWRRRREDIEELAPANDPRNDELA